MKKYFPLVLCFLAASVSYAQPESETSTSDLAKKLADPNATLGQMLFPIDYIQYGNALDESRQNAFVVSFQPSLPISISDGLNLYVRPLVPIYISQPVIGSNGFEQRTALGNISADVAIGKTWPSKWITLVGVFGGFPTASDEALRMNYTTLGPELMVAKLTNFGTVGLIVSHAWGIGGSDADPSTVSVIQDNFWIASGGSTTASVTAGQYFYTINLKNAWQINASPTYSYNHLAEEGNRLTLPLGIGAQKVLKLGSLPVRIGAQYWYYVDAPDNFGPRHQIRFTIAPVVPLPW